MQQPMNTPDDVFLDQRPGETSLEPAGPAALPAVLLTDSTSQSEHRQGPEPALTLQVITDIAVFQALAAEWADLAARCTKSTLFQQWEWNYTWWQVYAGKRDKLHVVTFRQAGKLVGLLPLYRHSGRVPGDVCLQLIGTGELQMDEVASEYGDLLADVSLGATLSRQVLDYLQRFVSWTRVDLSCLLHDSILYQAIDKADRSTSLLRFTGMRYRLSLLPDEAAYFASLSKSRVRRIRRSQRALLREGGMEASPIHSINCFDEAFRELAELNHERQTHKQRKSVFASSRFRHFHYELCLRLHDAGSANIIRYRLGNRLLAVMYCFYDAKSCYYYQSGFALKDANRFTPLTIAHLMEMQRNREAGRLYYDFMRGDADSYKADFNCDTTPMSNVSIYRWRWQRTAAIAYRWIRSTAAGALVRWTAQ
jgi:CelD/BcsL family acetyltransferase involved in cellulose biosynthesis